MSTVFHQREAVTITELTELDDLLRKTKIMHRQNRFCPGTDFRFDFSEIRLALAVDFIEIEGISICKKGFNGRPANIRGQQDAGIRRNFQSPKCMVNGMASPKELAGFYAQTIRESLGNDGKEFPRWNRLLRKQPLVWPSAHREPLRRFLSERSHAWRKTFMWYMVRISSVQRLCQSMTRP